MTLTLFVLAQSNPWPNKSTLESISVQEIKVKHGLSLGCFGLLGLFGVFGLAALDGKKHEAPVRYRETDEENYFAEILR